MTTQLRLITFDRLENPCSFSKCNTSASFFSGSAEIGGIKAVDKQE